MNRRDFLLLRTDAGTRVAELSCERLYMHYQQTHATRRSPGGCHVPTPADVWDEEPPAVFVGCTTEQLLGEVERRLRGADVLRVSETEWLAVDVFGREVDRVLAAFRRRGGHVAYQGCATRSGRARSGIPASNG